MFSRVYLSLQLFACVYLGLQQFNRACLPMFMNDY